jgi:hypothetical protein
MMSSLEDRYNLAEEEVGQGQANARRASAYKMVEAFAGITRRRLWLKSGTPARTDGYEIVVPLEDPTAYKILEHRLAHILFRTDPQARKVFIQEYTQRVVSLVEKNGQPLREDQRHAFAELLCNVLDAVECHRVESLWSLLYEGSYRFGRENARLEAEALLEHSHDSFSTFLSGLEAGADIPSGRLDRFRPYCVEAFRKAEHRGYNATLVVSKWLITHLVSEILREAQDLPPPPDIEAKVPDLAGTNPEGGGADAKPVEQPDDGEQDQPEGQAPEATASAEDREGTSVGNSGQMPEEGAEADEGGGAEGPGREVADGPDQDPKGTSQSVGQPDDDPRPGSGKWSPPRTDSSPEERAQALKDLIDRLGSDKQKQKSRFDDIKEPPAPEKGAVSRANQMVSEALRSDVNDSKALQQSLDASRGAMQKLLDQARDAFRQQMNHDDWLRKDAHAKVVFRDVRARDVVDQKPVPLEPEDQITILRLRALFNRVMGRRRIQLEEEGTEIDVAAYIERRVTRTQIPVYRHEVRGQGFKPLLLIDRSGSMGGDKQAQSERAAHIVAEALRYPFVDLHVWGFQSLANGQIDITRFDPRLRVYDSAKSRVAGFTPLHLAVRTALRFLERGAEMKHLFVVTDGFPVYSRKDGKSFNTKQLLGFVRDEVQQARMQGIATSGAIIGTRHTLYSDDPSSVYYDLGPRELRFMFGAPRFWRQLDPNTFGQDLVRLISSSFLDYLNRA